MKHIVAGDGKSIVTVKIIGDFGIHDVKRIGQELVTAVTTIENKNPSATIGIIVDYTNAGTMLDEASFFLTIQIFKSLEEIVCAIVLPERHGAVYTKANYKKLLKKAGRNNMYRFFTDAQEATIWMQEEVEA